MDRKCLYFMLLFVIVSFHATISDPLYHFFVVETTKKPITRNVGLGRCGSYGVLCMGNHGKRSIDKIQTLK